MFIADTTRGELNALRELIEAGKVTPVIDRTYPLSEIQEAIRYLEEGHARGKVIITMDDETAP
jgi:NADPH:quinone reductase-like Zn-dependent oxidoreductase